MRISDWSSDVCSSDLARHVVVGWDFCFGHKRAGNAGLLKSMGAQHGFGVTAVEPVMTGEGEVYYSSIIRAHLREGRPRKAVELLGRPWESEGRVEHGGGGGRRIGYPKAKIGRGAGRGKG